MSGQYFKEIGVRRTIYALSDEPLQLDNKQIVELVENSIALTPSAFNSQTTRAIVLFGAHHKKLWNEFAAKPLKAIVGDAYEQTTGPKIARFAAAYGTVLFYEDADIIKGLQEKFALYAEHFPAFASQSSGAAHITLWRALALENIGANLQHYNAIVEKALAEEYKVPQNWNLTAQLVFGKEIAPPSEKTTLPGSEVVKSFS